VIVQQSQAEKNRAAAIAAAEAAKVAKSEQKDKPMKIYVGNLPANTTEELLRKTFSK
jgi:RNA recognition motif-containing protein